MSEAKIARKFEIEERKWCVKQYYIARFIAVGGGRDRELVPIHSNASRRF
jgi:hypothetical protein